jgi:hypothetical protein
MDFQAARLAEGFDALTERVWPATEGVPVHSHPFAALDAPALPPVPQP